MCYSLVLNNKAPCQCVTLWLKIKDLLEFKGLMSINWWKITNNNRLWSVKNNSRTFLILLQIVINYFLLFAGFWCHYCCVCLCCGIFYFCCIWWKTLPRKKKVRCSRNEISQRSSDQFMHTKLKTILFQIWKLLWSLLL